MDIADAPRNLTLTSQSGFTSPAKAMQGKASQDQFGFLGGSQAGDIDGDGLTDLVVGAAKADRSIAIQDTGAIYIVTGDRAPLAQSALPLAPKDFIASAHQPSAASTDSRWFVLEDSLPASQAIAWYQFSTDGDGQPGDFIRSVRTSLARPNEVDPYRPLILALYTADGEVVATGPQSLLSLDRIAKGSYLLAVRRRDYESNNAAMTFTLEMHSPAVDHIASALHVDRDNIDGGDGEDIIVGGLGLDRISGGDGIDQIQAESIEVMDKANTEILTFKDYATDRANKPADDILSVPDAALRMAIARALQLPVSTAGVLSSPITRQQLAQLSELEIASIAVVSMAGLEAAINLSSLSIAGTFSNLSALTPSSNPNLKGARFLEHLSVTNSLVADWSDLAVHSHLKSLALSGSNFSDLSKLPAAPFLSLDLSSTLVSASSLASAVAGYTLLESLKLGGLGLTSAQVNGLASLDNLIDLDLRNNKLTTILFLNDISSLKSVILTGNPLDNTAYESVVPALVARGVLVTIDANLPPEWSSVESQVTSRNTPITIPLTVSDPEQQALAIQAFSNRPEVLATWSDGILHVEPTGNFSGLATISLVATEPGTGSFGRSATREVRVYVGQSLATGLAFEDTNGDGLRNVITEPVLRGATVYLDENGNGRLDALELRTFTSTEGQFDLAYDSQRSGVVRLLPGDSNSFTSVLSMVETNVPARITDSPGETSSNPENFLSVNGALFFTAAGVATSELWILKEQGKPIAIRMLNAGMVSSNPTQLTLVGDRIFFAGLDSTGSSRLWVVNADGTGLQAVWTNEIFGPEHLMNAYGRLFFSATNSNSGRELWALNADATNLQQLTEAVSGSDDQVQGSDPRDLQIVGGRLFFTVDNPSLGRELASVPLTTQGLQVSTKESIDLPKAILDNSTVTSVLEVNGLSGYLTDVNVSLTINHTFDSDLDVFLISPSGRHVELFRQVGTSGQNFTGTILDGQSNRSIREGFAPFLGSYRPSSPLSAFNGEQPNGEWMIEVSDHAGGDTGELTQWSLTITATELEIHREERSIVQPAVSSADVPVAISDLNTVTSTLTVADQIGLLADVNVSLNISHTFDNDLSVFIISPSGKRVELFNRVGGADHDFADTTFDDQAHNSIFTGNAPFNGVFRPAGSLAQFNGEPANGVWTLEIKDQFSGDSGTLNSWSLSTTTFSTAFAGQIEQLTELDGSLFFVANNQTGFGEEVFRFDPSTNHSSAIRTLNGGQLLSNIRSLTAANGRLYFVATDSVLGEELWSVNAQGSDLVLHTSNATAAADGSPADLSVFNTHLFFSANAPAGGRELWLLDTTAPGALPISVRSLNSGLFAKNPMNLNVVADRLVFSAEDDATGRELWSVSASGSELRRLTDLAPGPQDASPTGAVELAGRLMFVATTPESGTELWTFEAAKSQIVLASIPIVSLPGLLPVATIDSAWSIVPVLIDPTPSSSGLSVAWEIRNSADQVVASGNTVAVEFVPNATGAYTLNYVVDDITGAGVFSVSRQLNVLPRPEIDVEQSDVVVTESSLRVVRVRLNRAPTSQVVVSIVRTAGDTDLSISPFVLSFNPEDWNQWQAITISAVRDTDAQAGIATFTLSSAGWVSATIVATEADAERTFNASLGMLSLVEGSSGSLTVKLSGAPENSVTVSVQLSGTGLALTSPATLVFTADNWHQPQAITVEGLTDVDGIDGAGSISLSAVGWTTLAIPVQVHDDDRVILLTGQTEIQEGQQTNYSVALGSDPEGTVTVDLALYHASGLSITGPSSFTFDSSNWSTPQVLTVSAFADADAINGAALLRASANNWDSPTLGLISLDDERGILVTLNTDRIEEGGELSYELRLAGKPSGPLLVTTSFAGDSSFSILQGAVLVFTPENWNLTQIVRLAADIDDDAAEGAITLTSSAPDWAAASVIVKELDKDRRIEVLNNTADDPLLVNEGAASIARLRLKAQPAVNETVIVSVHWQSGDADLSANISQLTFDASNWNIPQQLTIQSIGDTDTVDGRATFVLVADGWEDASLHTKEVDDGQWWDITNESLVIGEDGTATLGVRLRQAPEITTEVTAELLAGGDSNFALVAGATLSFDNSNWQTYQAVQISVNDDLDVLHGHAVLRLNRQNNQSLNVTLTEVDDDAIILASLKTNSISGQPATVSLVESALKVPEGGTATYSIRLGGQPSQPIVVATTISGDSDLNIISGGFLSFDATNWNIEQVVTVVAIQDTDSRVGVATLTSAASNWQSGRMTATEVDDERSLVVSGAEDIVVNGQIVETRIQVPESGTKSIAVRLAVVPENEVRVTTLVTGADADLGILTPNELIFDESNWNVPQLVTLSAIDDSDSVNGTSILQLKPQDESWPMAQVTAVEADSDPAALHVVSEGTLVTSELGNTATFTVALATRPSGIVTVPVRSNDASEVTTSTLFLTFDESNWNIPQTVKVSGVDDRIADGTTAVQILLGPTTGNAQEYRGVNALPMSVQNMDDDVAGVQVSAAPNLLTSESGDQAQFSVVLSSQPLAPVILPLSIDLSSEAALSATRLVFDAANWNVPQAITVTGLPDSVNDEDRLVKVIFGLSASADPLYSGQQVEDVPFTNIDQDASVRSVGLNPLELLNVSDTLYFVAEHPVYGSSLWKTVGSSSGAALVRAFGSGKISQLTASGTRLYFAASTAEAGEELWQTDGTFASTSMVSELLAGPGRSDPRNLTVAGDWLVFTAKNGVGQVQLWAVSRTGNMPRLLSNETNLQPQELTTVGNHVYFTAESNANGRELWRTNSSFDGIEFVNDVRPGAASSNLFGLTSAGDKLYFIASDDLHGQELWVSDGTSIGTELAYDLKAGPDGSAVGQLIYHSGRLYFTDGDRTLWVTDGTDSGTTKLMEFERGLGGLVSTLQGLYFRADDKVTGLELWITDGTVFGTRRLSDINLGGTGSLIDTITPISDGVIFTAYQPSDGVELWRTDGTASGTRPLTSVRPGVVGSLASAITWSGNDLYFVADAGVDGPQIYVSNGNAPGLQNLNQAGVILSTNNLTIQEGGASTEYSIRLATQPTSDVYIQVAAPELLISPRTLVFSSTNWDIPQIVNVDVADDFVARDVKSFTISHQVTSGDAIYHGLVASQVVATVIDNDHAGVTILAPSYLRTSESGDTVVLSAVLNSQPSSNVSFLIVSTDVSEGVLDKFQLTFTPANWNVPQVLTVTGVDDAIDDGDVVYQVLSSATASNDPFYNGLTVDDTDLVNTDNELAPRFTISDVSRVEGSAGTSLFEFVVNLSHGSSEIVKVDYSTTDASATTIDGDYQSSSGTLTFVPGGSLSQKIIVPVLGDERAEPDELFLVSLSNAVAAVIDDSQAVGTIVSDDLTVSVQIDSTSIRGHQTHATSGYVDIHLNIPEGLSLDLSGYSLAVRTSPSSGLRLVSAAEAPNAVFAGRAPQVFGTGNRIEVSDVLPNANQSELVLNGASLFRLNFEVDPGIGGTFILSIEDLVLVDSQGTVVALTNANEGAINVQLDGVSPRVTSVRFAGTSWAANFPIKAGYAVPTSLVDQLKPLPWINLNQFQVTFSENVEVSKSDALLLGVRKPLYAFLDGEGVASTTGFYYDPSTFTATWTIVGSIGADKLLVELNDTIHDVSGNALDGEWQNSALSGNGAPGGDFELRVNVLPGDVNQSGSVFSDDVVRVRDNQFVFPGNPRYKNENDVNGSGSIFSDDVVAVRDRQFVFLPAGEPIGNFLRLNDINAKLVDAVSNEAYGPEDIALEDIETIRLAAIERWRQAGLIDSHLAQMETVTIQLQDLPRGKIGLTTQSLILIDLDASGLSWFVDNTPLEDSEFSFDVVTREFVRNDDSIGTRIDLLTLVMHELGHIVGLDDLLDQPDTMPNVMNGHIASGVRRLPVWSNSHQFNDSEVKAETSQAVDLDTIVIPGEARKTKLEKRLM